MSQAPQHPFELPPWQAPLWERMQLARRASRLPHALLLTGLPGMGKHLFARALAQALFCARNDSDGRPCGRCHGCHLAATGAHPGFQLVEPDPEGKSQDIKVEAIRTLSSRGVLTAADGTYKVILITPAEQMNLSAANSLLKTLEEPVAATLIILISAEPHKLPATIRSRCQRLHFPPPDQALARAWLAERSTDPHPERLLALAGGAPLAALELAAAETQEQRLESLRELFAIRRGEADPIAVAERWLCLPAARQLGWLSGWLIDLLRLQNDGDPPALFNPDRRDDLHALGKGLDCRGLHGMLAQVLEARRGLGSTLNLQLCLEELLIDWAELGG